MYLPSNVGLANTKNSIHINSAVAFLSLVQERVNGANLNSMCTKAGAFAFVHMNTIYTKAKVHCAQS